MSEELPLDFAVMRLEEQEETSLEIWELANEHGEGCGVLYDRNCGEPIPEGYYFRVAEVWVRLGDKILLTRRHPEKWAGLCWEVPGGGVLMGEEPVDAASRELFEETGISVAAADLVFIGSSTHQNAIVYSFFAELQDEPVLNLQPTEVVDYRFLTPDDAERMRDEMTVGTSARLDIIKCRF